MLSLRNLGVRVSCERAVPKTSNQSPNSDPTHSFAATYNRNYDAAMVEATDAYNARYGEDRGSPSPHPCSKRLVQDLSSSAPSGGVEHEGFVGAASGGLAARHNVM